ncbi:MAG: ABC transporter permease [Gammaproteobacteria bacterium]|nr:ABC transporter permease [Gammaproteobacteria bacterium]
MGQYIIRRLISSIPSLILVSIIIFGLLRLIPGDVVMARLSESGYVTEEDLNRMREQLGLNRNPIVQYFDWAGHAVRGDLGTSLWTSEEVLPTIVGRIGISMQLAGMAMVIAVVIAIPIGVISAVRQNSWVDYASRLFSIMGLSIPDFWIATMLLLFLSLYVGWLPQFGWFVPWEDPSRNLQALIFPALIIGYRFSAVSARMTRSAMLEVMREDYVRTARAKGLRERTVIVRHALRNGLIPVITIMGTQLSFLLGGIVIIEQIFSLPGMGRLTFDAVTHRDYPIVQGSVMTMALIFIIANLAVDLSYALIDPRIRYS